MRLAAKCMRARGGTAERSRCVVQVATMFPCLDELQANSQQASALVSSARDSLQIASGSQLVVHLEEYLNSAGASRKLGRVMLEHCRASVQLGATAWGSGFSRTQEVLGVLWPLGTTSW